MRIVALDGNDVANLAGSIEYDFRFRGFKIDGAALFARFEKHFVQCIQTLQRLKQCCVLLGQIAFVIGQNRRDFGIGETGVGMHHRRIKFVTLDLAIHSDDHVARHAEAIHFGVQRAQPVGQRLRQHGNNAAGKINRGAAAARFLVKRITFMNVVAYVGDGDDESKTFAIFFAVHCIIEIFCRFAVYGHQR